MKQFANMLPAYSSICRFLLVPVILALPLSCLLGLAASMQKGLVIQNFRSPLEFHKAPHQQQMKSFLEGARAEPLPGERYRLTKVRLQTFREQGQPEMRVEAPESIFDRAQRTISSPGPLRVETADGKFLIEGEGYIWIQTNSWLAISNRVRTVVHPDLLNQDTAEAADSPDETGPIEIQAARFEYSEQQEAARYYDGVQVSGTNLLMRSKELSITVPIKERQVKAIEAREEVTLDYGDISAEGQLANYWAASGILRVSGEPRWKGQDQEGAADMIIVDRPNRVFDADGNAFLRMTGKGGIPGGVLVSPASKGPATTEETGKVVEVRSQTYQLRTNSASFRGNVRVVQEAVGESPVSMKTERMNLTYTGTNELQSLAAAGGVLVQQADAQLKSEEMAYEAATAKARFTGSPEWRAEERRGRGDLIEVDTERQEMVVTGNAWMELPAEELGDAGSLPLPKSSTVVSNTTSNLLAEVTCDEYRVAPGKAVFSGKVRVRHPQIAWASDHITVSMDERSGAQVLVAEPHVRFEVRDPKGESIHGTGDKAVYTRTVTPGATNAVVELFGSPASLQRTNGMILRNQKLLLDVNRGTLQVPPGTYELLGPTNGVDTNVFRTPGKELLLDRKPRVKR